MAQVINLFVKPNPSSQRVHEKIQHYLRQKKIAISYVYQPDALCNLVIGGDGSFLRAIHTSAFSSLPFLGVNTGHLGFFQELHEGNVLEGLDRFLAGDYGLNTQGLLAAKIKTSSWTYQLEAVNEFVLHSPQHKMLHLRLSVDSIPFIDTSGDGLIFSTPSGSTAYNLSSGGAILYQTLSGYQISSLAPVRSKMYDSLPSSLVLPKEAVSKVLTEEKSKAGISILCDGVEHPYIEIEEIEIFVPETVIHRVVFQPHGYWANLREKLF